MNTKAFSLIELLIVISIIAILSTITLRMNRSKIKDMEAMNDKEKRLSRHRKENNIITNTNYINHKKVSKVTFEYKNWSWSITENISGDLLTYKLENHTISGDLIITKETLSLGCSTNHPNQEKPSIMLIWPNQKASCFTLNTNLCSRSPCKK